MKKAYKMPSVISEQIQIGVFGCTYNQWGNKDKYPWPWWFGF